MLFQTMLHAKRFREELTCMVQWFLPPPTFLVFFTDALLGSMRLPKTAVSRYKRLREKIRIPKRVTEFPTSDSWILLWTCRSVLSQYFTFIRNRIKLSNQTISWSMDQIMSQRPLPIPVSERPECMSLLLKLFFIFTKMFQLTNLSASRDCAFLSFSYVQAGREINTAMKYFCKSSLSLDLCHGSGERGSIMGSLSIFNVFRRGYVYLFVQ